MKSLFVLLFTFLNFLVASTSIAKPSPSVGDLKNQVASQNKKISKIKKEITDFEKNLNLNHKTYLSVIAHKQEVELRLIEMRDAQLVLKQSLLTQQKKAKRTLAYQVLHQLNTESEPGQILARKILMNQLSQQLKLIEAELKSHEQAEKLLSNLEQRFYEHEKTEIELISVLRELENRKKTVAQTYLDQQKKLDDLTQRYSQVRAQITRSKARSETQVTHLRFSPPLQDYQSMDHGDKGVSFSFRGRQPVVSTQEGEIVYAGELSTFGNVVMIDHGDDTRSVILGDFLPRAEKGLRVRVGDVIGYTTDRLQQGQVYFEIRKQNTVVNTIHLMDSRVIDSSALAKR